MPRTSSTIIQRNTNHPENLRSRRAAAAAFRGPEAFASTPPAPPGSADRQTDEADKRRENRYRLVPHERQQKAYASRPPATVQWSDNETGSRVLTGGRPKRQTTRHKTKSGRDQSRGLLSHIEKELIGLDGQPWVASDTARRGPIFTARKTLQQNK